MSEKRDPERVVREIKRKTRRRFSAEEKIRIVLEGLKGEDTIAGLCRREGIVTYPRIFLLLPRLRSPRLIRCWERSRRAGRWSGSRGRRRRPRVRLRVRDRRP